MSIRAQFLICFFFIYSLFQNIVLRAQGQVWNATGNMQKNANQKINKEKTKVKDYAKRLQEWGLDTNYNRGLLLGAKANSNGWSGCVYYVTRNKKNAQSSTSSASLK